MHDFAAILREVLRGYALDEGGPHGVGHWARVAQTGARLAELTGADAEVVELFALFHDSRRVNDGTDDGHGLRGAELAASLRGTLVHLDDARFGILFEACRLHTAGRATDDATVRACWDADRLDLGRVGITPAPHRLGSDAARSLLNWAHGRAVVSMDADGVLARWGYGGAG